MLNQYVVVKAIQEVTSMPNKAFSVRGLAKVISISPGAAGAALKFMKKKGIATITVIGKTHQYRANLDSALCRQWKILFNTDFLVDSGIIGEMLEKISGVQSLLLYGSLAKGTNDEKSDIDLLAITSKPAKNIPAIGKTAGKEINLSVFSFSDWKKKAVQEKVFYENVIFDSVVLFGERPVVV